MFWYEDGYLNKNVCPTPFFEFQIDGTAGIMKKIDNYTIAFEFPEPYAFFVSGLQEARASAPGSPRAASSNQSFGGACAPARYLKQFLPKYSSEEAVNKEGRGSEFRQLGLYGKNRYSWARITNSQS